ncbi:MAG: hypothetical protein AB2L24_12760 [Mangrovibacterium sp.]
MKNLKILPFVISIVCLFAFVNCGKEKKQDNLFKGQGIILNIPADAIVIEPDWGGDIGIFTKEQAINALNSFIDKYYGTQVSGLFFNINYQRACFDSKVMESYWNLQNPETHMTGWPRGHWEIYKKGIDPFEICIARSRYNSISPWISIRMNDHHYFEDSTRINRLWLDHPELRRTPYGLFNYAKEEVRDYYKAFIKEVLDKYDMDGIELDWMRTNSLFLKDEEIHGMELINQFMREIRELTRQRSAELGHPVKIAVRVPSTPEIGKSCGLDGVSWVKEGLVDILTPTNWHNPTNFDIPFELWREEIGSGLNYTLTAGADMAHCIAKSKHLKQMYSNIESMRGFAISSYSRGADAIYIFNHFLPTYKLKVINPDGTIYFTDDKKKVLNETGDLSTSLGKPRTHVFTFTDPDIKPRPMEAPILLKDVENEFKIYSGPKPTNGNYTIRIGLELLKGFENAHLTVKVNDKYCQQIEDMPRDPAYVYDNTKIWHEVRSTSETGARVMQFEADLKAIKNGYNRISIVNTQNEEQAITWLEVYID